jgi:maltooligosyltrehalose trehalohydrolase
MGEEWGCLQPFPFFCDFTGQLAGAVRTGRRREFADAYRHQDRDGEIPDPLAQHTYRSAILDWHAQAQPRYRARLDLVKRLLQTRHRHVTPLIAGAQNAQASAVLDGAVLHARWAFTSGALSLLANLSPSAAERTRTLAGTSIWGGALSDGLPPWSVHWAVEKA